MGTKRKLGNQLQLLQQTEQSNGEDSIRVRYQAPGATVRSNIGDDTMRLSAEQSHKDFVINPSFATDEAQRMSSAINFVNQKVSNQTSKLQNRLTKVATPYVDLAPV